MVGAIRFVVLFLLASALAGGARADWYGSGHGRAPVGLRVYICHGYGCRIVTPVQLSPQDFRSIAAPLRKARSTPASEREAISRAVQTFEKIVGKRVGTANDLAGTQVGQAADDQLDCIDEATNTTTLLTILAENGALKLHGVGEPAARGFFLDGRYPHATAVVSETASGDRWAIDSWPRAGGEAPVIQPLSVWFASRSGDPLPENQEGRRAQVRPRP